MIDASDIHWRTFRELPLPARALATCVIATLALGLLGALAQIWVHDIVPTFFGTEAVVHETSQDQGHAAGMSDAGPSMQAPPRGDLFSELAVQEKKQKATSLLDNEQFVWTLKWTHIHLFGINMIFILMGVLVLFLDVSSRARAWLIVLPFAGVLVDILAMWLKAFVSPVFFWLHVPGGGVFAGVFCFVSLRALREMWGASGSRQISSSVKSSP